MSLRRGTGGTPGTEYFTDSPAVAPPFPHTLLSITTVLRLANPDSDGLRTCQEEPGALGDVKWRRT